MTLVRDSLGLPKSVQADLVSRVEKQSAFAQVARTTTLTDEVTTTSFADLAPAQFREEGALKPSGELTPVVKTMRLQYLASLVTPYSKQSTLSQTWESLYEQIVQTHKNSIATGLDWFILNGNPIAGVDTLKASPSIEYAGNAVETLTAARKAVAGAPARVNGYVASTLGEVTLSSATDLQGRPIFGLSNDAQTTLNGSRLAVSSADFGDTVAVAGDFNQMVIGFHPDNVTAQVLTEYAEINGTPRALKQYNEVAVFFEIPVSVAILRQNAFVKITDAVA